MAQLFAHLTRFSTNSKKLFRLFFAEFLGMALLMLVGLSMVIIIWGPGSAFERYIPSVHLRRLFSGFVFGAIGCAITMSPLGRISGAHLNPAVSFSFWLRGKMKAYAMLGYIFSQLLGAVVGCLPLLWLWHNQKSGIYIGATTPGKQGNVAAYLGEMAATACLITTIYIFVGSRSLRNYTPYVMPFLSGIMAAVESFLSGCSTNPARTFGPAVVGNIFTGFWVYILGPVCGVLFITGIFRWFRLHHYYHIEAARLSYHDHSSPECLKTS